MDSVDATPQTAIATIGIARGPWPPNFWAGYATAGNPHENHTKSERVAPRTTVPLYLQSERNAKSGVSHDNIKLSSQLDPFIGKIDYGP